MSFNTGHEKSKNRRTHTHAQTHIRFTYALMRELEVNSQKLADMLGNFYDFLLNVRDHTDILITHTHTHTLAHTQSHTHTHAQRHTHTHTHTLSTHFTCLSQVCLIYILFGRSRHTHTHTQFSYSARSHHTLFGRIIILLYLFQKCRIWIS